MTTFKEFIIEKDITLQYHKELNQLLWEDSTLRPVVRNKLLAIAEEWKEFSKIPDDAVIDIVFTGGNANYNYTTKSDIDIHFILNPDKMPIAIDIFQDYFSNKKDLWAYENPFIKIKGYTVELYAQPEEQGIHQDQGVYSLKNDTWITKPQYKSIDFSNNNLLNFKVEYFRNKIDKIIDGKVTNTNKINKLKDKLKALRKSGIEKGGEFSFENLVYKELRNEGYIEALWNYATKVKDLELSLEQKKYLTTKFSYDNICLIGEGK